MLKETCHDADIMPDKVFKDGEDYILYWDWIKWREDYEDVFTESRKGESCNDLPGQTFRNWIERSKRCY